MRRFSGVQEHGPDILRHAMRATGRRILAGALDAPPPPPKVDPVLAALETSPAIRKCVGRLDISGDKNAVAWATIERQGERRELVIRYKYGREVAADLAKAAEPIIEALNFRKTGLEFVLRQRSQGAWEAVFWLKPAALSCTRTRGPIMTL